MTRRGARDPAQHYWSGRAALDRGDWEGAAVAFRRAVARSPGDAASHRALGLALARLDKFKAAIAAFRAAIERAPGMARAHSDLGVTLLKVKRATEAIAPLERALALDPTLEQARICLGLACAHAGQPDRALEILDRTVRDSTDPEILTARAWAMLHQGRVGEALDVLARTLELSPQHAVAHYNLLFTLQHQPGITAASLLDRHRHWAASLASVAEPGLPEIPRQPGRLPTLGIVSGDLRQHAVSLLTLRAFEALARNGTRIVCFANQSEEDGYTRRFKAFAWRWHVVDEIDDDGLCALIRRERIGILFDLSGLTARHRLPVFARRAAPLQVSWAGYTGTTGLSTMDALIADAREVPAGEDHAYAERVLRLPDGYVCYDPPARAPDIGPARGGALRFGCFHRAAKLNTGLLALWARIAAELPDARFVLRYACYAEPQTRRVVTAMAEQAGLAADRLAFEEGRDPASMLQGYGDIDIALDTTPYSGGVTTLEALWMGVPVITLRGETFAGRHGVSHLHAAGLAELIADTSDAYVAKAVALARDRARLGEYRATLRARLLASPLMDGVRFAANLEAALLSLWTPAEAAALAS